MAILFARGFATEMSVVEIFLEGLYSLRHYWISMRDSDRIVMTVVITVERSVYAGSL
jgi:hypothetical protein